MLVRPAQAHVNQLFLIQKKLLLLKISVLYGVQSVDIRFRFVKCLVAELCPDHRSAKGNLQNGIWQVKPILAL